MSSVSLWEISEAVLGLSEIIESPETTEEEKATARAEIERWAAAQVNKVDPVRSWLKHCRMLEEAAELESVKQSNRSKMWAARARRMKDICIAVMQAQGKTRLEGNTGVLRLQKNGGQLALNKVNESLIPEDYKTYTFRLSAILWQALQRILDRYEDIGGSSMMSVTIRHAMLASAKAEWNNEAIRKVLETKCTICEGSGKCGHAVTCETCGMRKSPRGRSAPLEMANSLCDHECSGYEQDPIPGGLWPDETDPTCASSLPADQCGDCNGTGHQLVPGAELAERGVSLRVE